ncbi:hypothetical protein GCM10010174_03740 [Kutzneria viridogrisea]|uniref:CAAX protease self-immunity n=1 Tax=Kutzneria viridogrisea TaxID=47990 RepID=A0ABR6BRG8_9PSEU|nr:hypothetical protein [Kutzneria viridogrisea]
MNRSTPIRVSPSATRARARWLALAAVIMVIEVPMWASMTVRDLPLRILAALLGQDPDSITVDLVLRCVWAAGALVALAALATAVGRDAAGVPRFDPLVEAHAGGLYVMGPVALHAAAMLAVPVLLDALPVLVDWFPPGQHGDPTTMPLAWQLLVSTTTAISEEILILAVPLVLLDHLRVRGRRLLDTVPGVALCLQVLIALRCSYHLYQGPYVLTQAVVAAATGVAYLCCTAGPRIWPVIFGHALVMDLTSAPALALTGQRLYPTALLVLGGLLWVATLPYAKSKFPTAPPTVGD